MDLEFEKNLLASELASEQSLWTTYRMCAGTIRIAEEAQKRAEEKIEKAASELEKAVDIKAAHSLYKLHKEREQAIELRKSSIATQEEVERRILAFAQNYPEIETFVVEPYQGGAQKGVYIDIKDGKLRLR